MIDYPGKEIIPQTKDKSRKIEEKKAYPFGLFFFLVKRYNYTKVSSDDETNQKLMIDIPLSVFYTAKRQIKTVCHLCGKKVGNEFSWLFFF